MSNRELKALQDPTSHHPTLLSRITCSARRALLSANMVDHSPINKNNSANQEATNQASSSSSDTSTQTSPTNTMTGAPFSATSQNQPTLPTTSSVFTFGTPNANNMAAGWNRFNFDLNQNSQTVDNAVNNDAAGSLPLGTPSIIPDNGLLNQQRLTDMPITGANHKHPSLNKTTGPQRLGEAITREDIGNLMNVMDERVDRKLDELLKVMKEHFTFSQGHQPNQAPGNPIPSTMPAPAIVSSQAATVSTSPALTATATASCSNLLSVSQSLPTSILSTGYNLSHSLVTRMPHSVISLAKYQSDPFDRIPLHTTRTYTFSVDTT